MNIALVRSDLERLQRAAYIMITGAIRTTLIKLLEMFLDLTSLRTAVKATVLAATNRLQRSNLTTLETNRIWVKADKIDRKFKTKKNHTTLRSIFGEYRIVISTREYLFI